jgi:uncharacterized protein (TIGR00369 family)
MISVEANVRSGPLWDMIEGRSPLPAASRLLGWKLLTLDPAHGAIRVEFAAVPDFTNLIGTIQGGIITAMLDDAMGPVATAFLGGHHMAPTVELKTSFMRPATVGSVFVEAKVVHRGHDILFLEGAARDEEDKLIATATATARIYDWPKPRQGTGPWFTPTVTEVTDPAEARMIREQCEGRPHEARLPDDPPRDGLIVHEQDRRAE